MSTLRVGAARTNITPPLGTHLAGDFCVRLAEDVLDELHAKAVVIESGKTTVAWVVCDLVAMERAEMDRIKRLASDATGIPVEQIMVACTHTHTGPDVRPTKSAHPTTHAYLPWAIPKIADSVALAHRRLEPACVGHGAAACPEEVFNRRYHMTDGSVRMNPGYLNPDVARAAGPTDADIPFLVFQATDGRPLALVANYALHYVGGPFYLSISADYYGAFDRRMQELAGSDFVAVMTNGCSGDVNNIDVSHPAPSYPYPKAKVDAVADRVAGRVWEAWRQIANWQIEPRLAVETETFVFHRREVPAEELEQARRIVEGQEEADKLDRAYAEGVLALQEQPIQQPTELQAFVLGEVGLVTLPGEIFCELGLTVKQRSPFSRTLPLSLANDWLGYIPPSRSFDEGGYELRTTVSAKAARGTGEALIAAAVALLKRTS